MNGTGNAAIIVEDAGCPITGLRLAIVRFCNSTLGIDRNSSKTSP